MSSLQLSKSPFYPPHVLTTPALLTEGEATPPAALPQQTESILTGGLPHPTDYGFAQSILIRNTQTIINKPSTFSMNMLGSIDSPSAKPRRMQKFDTMSQLNNTNQIQMSLGNFSTQRTLFAKNSMTPSTDFLHNSTSNYINNNKKHKFIERHLSEEVSQSTSLAMCVDHSLQTNNNNNNNGQNQQQQPNHQIEPTSSVPATRTVFYQPVSLQIKPTMEVLHCHHGDSHLYLQEESALLGHSSLLESGHIRERNQSIETYHKLSNLFCVFPEFQRLIDLQEPRDSMDEDEGDLEDEDDYDNNEVPATPFRDKTVEELNIPQERSRMNSKIPSVSSSVNQTPQRLSIHMKVIPSSKRSSCMSQESTSIEGRTVRASTSETIISINQKTYQKTAFKPQSFSLKMIPSEDDDSIRQRRLSSTSSLLIIPDEPLKSRLNESCCYSARGGSRESLNEESKQQDIEGPLLTAVHATAATDDKPIPEKYFVPQLLRSFIEGQKDKESQLYQQYFQKMFLNYSDTSNMLAYTQTMLPHKSIYLPPLDTNSKQKTIFFDLDETLIHCIEIFQHPQNDRMFGGAGKWRNVVNHQTNAFQNSDPCNEIVCDIQYSKDTQFKCLVSIRPHAHEILKELAKDFELILLTASRKVYADAVLEKLDPEGTLFSHRFYRECCTEIRSVRQKGYLKDLRIFQNRPLSRVVLIDNSPISFSQQIENGIPIIDYCNDNKNDQELLRLSEFLKSEILHAADVREPVRKKFLLSDYQCFGQIDDLKQHLTEALSTE